MEGEMREEEDGAWEPQSKFFWVTKNGTVSTLEQVLVFKIK
jgi:hypothetical protein